MKKINLEDFLNLDVNSLFVINGGTDCSKSTNTYNIQHTDGDHCSCLDDNSSAINQNSQGKTGSSITTSDGNDANDPSNDGHRILSDDNASFTISTTGLCGGSSGSANASSQNSEGSTDSVISNQTEQTSLTEESLSGTEETAVTNQNLPERQTVTEGYEDEVHCDIIAWNHALDDGVDPRGNDGETWDGNTSTVDSLFNDHYADQAVDFDNTHAGEVGLIFYDWNNGDDGEGFDHVEYVRISDDGTSYEFYSNTGIEEGEILRSREFATDSNAGARNGGDAVVRFVSLGNRQ